LVTTDVISNKPLHRARIAGLVFTAVTIVAQMLQYKLAAEYLSPPLAGTWVIFLLFASYSNFFDFGFSPTLSREIAFAGGSNQASESSPSNQTKDLLKTVNTFFVFAAILLLTASYVLAYPFLINTAPPDFRGQIPTIYLIFISGIFVNILGAGALATLYGLGDLVWEKGVKISGQVIWICLSIWFSTLGWGMLGLAIAWSFQNIVTRIISFVVLKIRHAWVFEYKGTYQAQLLKRMLKPSISWSVMSLGTILILQTGSLVIASYLGPTEVLSYDFTLKMCMAILSLAMILANSSSPFISRSYAQNDLKSVRIMLFRNIKLGMIATLFSAAYLAVYADIIVNYWLGSQKFTGFPILWILLATIILEAHHIIHAGAATAAGKVVFGTIAIVAGVLNLIMALVAVRIFGVAGVAMAILVSQMVTNNWYAPFISFKTFNLGYRKYFRFVIYPLVLFGVFIVGINIIIRPYFEQPGVFSIFSSLILSFLCAIVLYKIIFRYHKIEEMT
jgi:O-antigen/teichoic acid export membrane protein